MSEAVATETAAPTTEAAGIDESLGFEERSQQIVAQFDAAREQKRNAAKDAELDAKLNGASEARTKDGEDKPKDGEVKDFASERAERMAKLRERQQKRLQETRARKEQPAQQPTHNEAHLREMHRRAVEYDRLTALLDNPDGILELAAARGVDPGALAESIIRAKTDPSFEAARRAKREMDPTLAEIKRDLEEVRSEHRRLAQERERFASEQAEQHARAQLVSSVSREQTPYAFALMETYGQNALLQTAEKLAQSLPDGSGLQAVIDALEASLEGEREQIARVYGFGSTPPKSAQRAVKASSTGTTLSNSLVSGRSSVDEEVELTQDERIEMMRRTMDKLRSR